DQKGPNQVDKTSVAGVLQIEFGNAQIKARGRVVRRVGKRGLVLLLGLVELVLEQELVAFFEFWTGLGGNSGACTSERNCQKKVIGMDVDVIVATARIGKNVLGY